MSKTPTTPGEAYAAWRRVEHTLRSGKPIPTSSVDSEQAALLDKLAGPKDRGEVQR
jgi:hypothetical protein